MTDSILESTKKNLGIADEYTAFDDDIILHINSVFATLNQLGIGPPDGYQITAKTNNWAEFIGTDMRLNPVKTYVYIRVRLLFDPPSTSYLVTALENQAKELEWRLNVHREVETYPLPLEAEL